MTVRAKLIVASSDPSSEEGGVTETTFLGPGRLTRADGYRVHTANCFRVFHLPEEMVEIQFCNNNGERIVLLTGARVRAGFVPALIDEMRKPIPD